MTAVRFGVLALVTAAGQYVNLPPVNPHPPAATARPTPWMRRLIALVSLGLALVLTAPAAAPASTSPDYYGLNVQTLFRLDSVAPERWGALPRSDARRRHDARADRRALAVRRAEPAEGRAAHVHVEPPVGSAVVDGSSGAAAGQPRHPDGAGALARPGLGGAAAAPGCTRATTATSRRSPRRSPVGTARAATSGGRTRTSRRCPVHEYELWTEANSTIFWTGGPNPAEYVAALRPVRDALHARGPVGEAAGEPRVAGLRELHAPDVRRGRPGAHRRGRLPPVRAARPGDHRARPADARDAARRSATAPCRSG